MKFLLGRTSCCEHWNVSFQIIMTHLWIRIFLRFETECRVRFSLSADRNFQARRIKKWIHCWAYSLFGSKKMRVHVAHAHRPEVWEHAGPTETRRFWIITKERSPAVRIIWAKGIELSKDREKMSLRVGWNNEKKYKQKVFLFLHYFNWIPMAFKFELS